MESASTFRKTRQGSVWNVMPEKIGDSAVNVHWDVYKRIFPRRQLEHANYRAQ